jgi:hypothetical protein
MDMCGMDGICRWTYGEWRGDMDAGIDASYGCEMHIPAVQGCGYYAAVSGLVY